jgi:hypothetical protein
MNTLSAASKSSLIVLLVLAGVSLGADPIWPVKGRIDLSSSFCDFRPRHFHGGIDIRTGGTEGRRIYSPVDGYVWRIRYSYIGYGKALYLKDSEGYIYVVGHLRRLSDRLEKVVSDWQYKKEKYSFDIYFEPDSIPVNCRELIAFSGQTGFGAPHIHFEKRNPSNMPLNPLSHGFHLEDKIPPSIEAVALVYKDAVSIFPNGMRRIHMIPRYDSQRQRYFLDTVILVRAPFGIEIKAFDRIRDRGPGLNICRARLFIDDYVYYEVRYENYDYAQTSMVDLCFNYRLAVEQKEYWHLLYDSPGKDFSGSNSLYKEGGIFSGRTHYSYGLHNARVEIYDAAGNMSELVFPFVVAPGGKFFDIEWISDTAFYLLGQRDIRYVNVKDVDMYITSDRVGWEKIPAGHVKPRGINDYYVTLPPTEKRLKMLMINVRGESGWVMTDQYVMPSNPKKHKYDFDYSLTGDGILFTAESLERFAPSPIIAIVYEDGYVHKVNTTALTSNKFAAFYKDDRIKTRIVRMDLHESDADLPAVSRAIELVPAGNSPDDKTWEATGGFIFSFGADDFYHPVYIRAVRVDRFPRHGGKRVSDVYAVEPSFIPLSGGIDIAFKLDEHVDKTKIGLYRLNSKNKWEWLDAEVDGGMITGRSGWMGTFVVLEDTEAPRVKNISPRTDRTVETAYPMIRCTITDNLSKIESDDQIAVFLDGQWLIPEYDPETTVLQTYPRAPLADGRHELVIKVSDRIGNSRTVHSHFFVKSG